MKNRVTASLACIALCTIAFSSCQEEDQKGLVKYDVTCNPPGCLITISNESGGTDQHTFKYKNWSTSFIADKSKKTRPPPQVIRNED